MRRKSSMVGLLLDSERASSEARGIKRKPAHAFPCPPASLPAAAARRAARVCGASDPQRGAAARGVPPLLVRVLHRCEEGPPDFPCIRRSSYRQRPCVSPPPLPLPQATRTATRPSSCAGRPPLPSGTRPCAASPSAACWSCTGTESRCALVLLGEEEVPPVDTLRCVCCFAHASTGPAPTPPLDLHHRSTMAASTCR